MKFENHLDILFLPEFQIYKIIDTNGRPLGEGKARECAKADVVFEYSKCPYSGSRKNHTLPMNISALGEITNQWANVSRLASHFRNYYYSQVDTQCTSLKDVYFVCEMCCQIPRLALISAPTIASKELPAIPLQFAAIYKTAIGLRGALRALITHCLLNKKISIESEIDSTFLYRFVEESDFLIGENEVCAGPALLIQRFLQIICERNSEAEKINFSKSEIDLNSLLKLSFCESSYFFYRAIIGEVATRILSKNKETNNNLSKKIENANLRFAKDWPKLSRLRLTKALMSEQSEALWSLNQNVNMKGANFNELLSVLNHAESSLDEKIELIERHSIQFIKRLEKNMKWQTCIKSKRDRLEIFNKAFSFQLSDLKVDITL